MITKVFGNTEHVGVVFITRLPRVLVYDDVKYRVHRLKLAKVEGEKTCWLPKDTYFKLEKRYRVNGIFKALVTNPTTLPTYVENYTAKTTVPYHEIVL